MPRPNTSTYDGNPGARGGTAVVDGGLPSPTYAAVSPGARTASRLGGKSRNGPIRLPVRSFGPFPKGFVGSVAKPRQPELGSYLPPRKKTMAWSPCSLTAL